MNIKNAMLICIFICFSCKEDKGVRKMLPLPNTPYIAILGIAQDGGYPHINNTAEFEAVMEVLTKRELVASLGLLDPKNQKKFLFEATPDMPEQLALLESKYLKTDRIIDGIFLTHAHMGHYTGLMHLGKEAMGSSSIPVMAMPKMKTFLESNGPWDQLIALKNIRLLPLGNETAVQVSSALKVTPFLVPHRDEYSETVGYKIVGPNKSALFIPDIDKWSSWDKDILEEVQKVDYAFLDATFFADGEIPRPMSEVPHPFVEETVAAFAKADKATLTKVIFIHFNHSNPALNPEFEGRKVLETQGFRFAQQGDLYKL